MSTPLALCLMVIATTAAPQLWACELPKIATRDKAVELTLTVAAATDCASFVTGDAVAIEIKVRIRASAAPAEVTEVSLKRDDGLAANGVPTVRKLTGVTFFADNLSFAAPGTWIATLTLRRGEKEEDVELALKAALPAAQIATIHADASKIPDFTFADPSGRNVTRAALTGKVWIATLFFASCPEICPLMTQKLATLQRHFKGARDFRLVSITTDPRVDTPEILAGLAKRHDADPARWFFLRGEKSAVVALSDGGLLLDATLASPMHSTKIALVGRDGIVKGRYESSKLEELEQLKLDAQALLAAK